MNKNYDIYKEFIFFLKSFVRVSIVTRGVLLILLLFIVILSLLFSFFENITIQKSLYFSFITALTVGYGDITPETTIGEFLSILIGLIGFIYFGIIVAMATVSLREAVELYDQELHR